MFRCIRYGCLMLVRLGTENISSSAARGYRTIIHVAKDGVVALWWRPLLIEIAIVIYSGVVSHHIAGDFLLYWGPSQSLEWWPWDIHLNRYYFELVLSTLLLLRGCIIFATGSLSHCILNLNLVETWGVFLPFASYLWLLLDNVILECFLLQQSFLVGDNIDRVEEVRPSILHIIFFEFFADDKRVFLFLLRYLLG